MAREKSEHVERVVAAAQSNSAAARSRLAASWRRSAEKHGLDPAEPSRAEYLDDRTLGQRRAEHEQFLMIASGRLDRLFALVGSSGCGVLLTDAEGLVLDRRCTDADEYAFEHWGLRPGADWSEAAEGTNGIGTCLAENRQVTIHRDQHFFARNIAMSCMDAPIYGADGTLLAALDVSSARADQTEAFNLLIAGMAAQTARQIEADNFRAAFPKARIVVADSDENDAAVLLAVDADDIVVGASRAARKAFGLEPGGRLKPRPASDLLGREDSAAGFERAARAAVIRALARASGNVSEAARALGVARATLYRRMKQLGIDTIPA